MGIGEFADLNFYPNLHEFAGDINPFMQKNDPLGVLLMGSSDTARQVAKFTERCLQQIRSVNQVWFSSKSKKLKTDRTPENVSAVLAEIRAYGTLIRDWGNFKIEAPLKNGTDFVVHCGTQTLRIEVNAPQWAGGTKITSQVLENITHGPFFSKVTEKIPFGMPRDLTKENFATMAISKICAIKQKEHQFSTDDFSVLWLDYWDPLLWLSPMSDHARPYLIHNTRLELGWLWNAFYAKKGDPTFDSVLITGASTNAIPLAHDGRFHQEDCKIDLTIISDPRGLFAFQNPNKLNSFSDLFFAMLVDAHLFRFEISWLDWPTRGTLSSKIERSRLELRDMLTALNTLGHSAS
ncbi:MAG: hypothetical protein M0T73_09850 [Deltaproteobacteria bacterium]|nr:hypothetical protein [Deltaproteobacteria bacterium]